MTPSLLFVSISMMVLVVTLQCMCVCDLISFVLISRYKYSNACAPAIKLFPIIIGKLYQPFMCLSPACAHMQMHAILHCTCKFTTSCNNVIQFSIFPTRYNTYNGGFLAVARKARAKNLATMPTFRLCPLINDRRFYQRWKQFAGFSTILAEKHKEKHKRRQSRLSFK